MAFTSPFDTSSSMPCVCVCVCVYVCVWCVMCVCVCVVCVWSVYMLTHTQTDKQTDRRTDRQMNPSPPSTWQSSVHHNPSCHPLPVCTGGSLYQLNWPVDEVAPCNNKSDEVTGSQKRLCVCSYTHLTTISNAAMVYPQLSVDS